MIDVIVPVYAGLAETRRCLESVMAAVPLLPFELVVVDDASPDPDIKAWLDRLAAADRITLVRNESNLGFVRSVNRGMSLHGDRDVVLLNSDTEVANDWLDRLRHAACDERDIGTATPFSNNATICTYPFEGWTGGLPGALGLARLDRLFAVANAGRTVELPTAVGFCMYIRRQCLDATGLFDAERFGRGYGEENDFCLRAAKAGWRSVLAGDVFVFHQGSVSFASERAALAEAATRTMLELHPHYLRSVREFICRDPARELRVAIDRARVACGVDEAQLVLTERAVERARFAARVEELEQLVTRRDAAVAELRQGLEQAQARAAECEAELVRSQAAKHLVESLAAERGDRLERIRKTRVWRLLSLVTRTRV